MARYECEICGKTFEQRSAYERHMQTSHPEQAPSAADLERALSGMDYPADRRRLVEHARDAQDGRIAEILRRLPEREYRDAAEVARAFGELRSHQAGPGHQPSVRGGREALRAPSAAHLASLLEGVSFPAGARDLADHARERADGQTMALIEALPERTYHDMAEVAEAFGEVVREGR